MSTTKIKGWVDNEALKRYTDPDNTDRNPSLYFYDENVSTFGESSALLVISSDGKPPVVLTEEEHEQKFQERAKAMLVEICGGAMNTNFGNYVSNIAARYGIALP